MTLLKRALDVWSYPRAVMVTIGGGLWTLFMSVIVFATAVLVRNRTFLDFLINDVWVRPIVWMAGVRVEVRGLENVRVGGPGSLILFNHSSIFDILVLIVSYPRMFRFGAKIELFDIPLFGAAMRLAGVLPIDRRNRTRVMAVYDSAIARVEAGESFALAPEGTRQPESRLGPFKRGPFEFAINARTDVQPVVIAGAFEVVPRNSIWLNKGRWRRRVIVEIAPPRSTSQSSIDDAQALLDETRAVMAPMFSRLNAELGYA